MGNQFLHNLMDDLDELLESDSLNSFWTSLAKLTAADKVNFLH